MITKKMKYAIPLMVMAIALAIPFSSQAGKLFSPEVGAPCSSLGTCIATTSPMEGSQGGSALSCGANSKCVPITSDIKMGTYCSHSSHCDRGTGQLELTCDMNKNICVGATENVFCAEGLVTFNPVAKDDIGWINTDLPEVDRCAGGLFCDVGDSGTCQSDLGSGFVPADKLGDTATDIRDQIRNIINIALGFLGVAGVIVTIYGGALWMTAFGDDEKVEKGKKTIIAGAIGLIIIGIAWTIVSYVLQVTSDIA